MELGAQGLAENEIFRRAGEKVLQRDGALAVPSVASRAKQRTLASWTHVLNESGEIRCAERTHKS